MKSTILSILLSFLLCCNGFAATESWETGKLPYAPSMSGSVCWTTMRVYKDDRESVPIFHSMDLSTGEIHTGELGDWYLIQTDLRKNGTLIARKRDGMLEIAQYSSHGKWEPFLEYPFDNTYAKWDSGTNATYDRPVMAYMDGCLYYMMSDGEHDWLRRDDMQGNVYDYSTGYDLTRISPNGSILGVDDDGEDVVETADGSIFKIGDDAGKNRSYFPVGWLDEDHLLLWVRELDADNAQFLYTYAYRENQLTPLYNPDGEHIPCLEGGEGYTGSCNPSTGQFVQLVYWAEDFFCVPTVLDPSTGIPVFIAETEHTDEYDEYCNTNDRVIWQIAG